MKKIFFEGDSLVNTNLDADWDEWYFLNNYNRFTNLFTRSKNLTDFDILEYQSRIIE